MKKNHLLIIAALLVVVGAVFYYTGFAGGEARRGDVSSKPDAVESAVVDQKQDAAVDANTPVSAVDAAPAVVAAPKREAGALTDALPVGVAQVAGNPLVASVLVDSKRTPDLSPNQVGEFPRVYIKPGQKVSVRLRFPAAEAGARASVSVEDGGFVADKKAAIPLTLDAERVGEFEFTAGMEPGQYRVAVRQGADTRILVLWAEA